MTYEKDGRLASYVVMASLPAMGIAGAATSALVGEIIHYGGPAITIERTMSSSFSEGGNWGRMQWGSGGIFAPDSDGSYGSAKNFAADKSQSSGKMFAHAQGAKLGVNFDLSTNMVALGTTGEGKGFLRMVNASEQISKSNFNPNTNIAKVAFSTTFHSSSGTPGTSNRTGSWALDSEGNETRGYAAISFWPDDVDAPGMGWMDIGWDGHTLTIYDWAFNTDGAISAGDTGGATAVPGGAGLAALAMGAAGMRRRRKRVA
jgi:MYXO-CTERM domain-containing protein